MYMEKLSVRFFLRPTAAAFFLDADFFGGIVERWWWVVVCCCVFGWGSGGQKHGCTYAFRRPAKSLHAGNRESFASDRKIDGCVAKCHVLATWCWFRIERQFRADRFIGLCCAAKIGDVWAQLAAIKCLAGSTANAANSASGALACGTTAGSRGSQPSPSTLPCS